MRHRASGAGAATWRRWSGYGRAPEAGASVGSSAALGEQVAQPAYGFDGFHRALAFELASQPTYKHFDHVWIALLVIAVELLHQALLGHYLLLMAHQILEDAVFVGGQ